VNFRLCIPLFPAALLVAHVALAAEPDLPWVFNAPRAEGYTIDWSSQLFVDTASAISGTRLEGFRANAAKVTVTS